MYEICTKCKKHKPLWAFDKHKKCNFGIKKTCKVCQALYNKEWHKKRYEADPEYFKEIANKWKKTNPEKVKEYNKKWYKANPEYFKEYEKKRYESNKEYFKEKTKEYRNANPKYFKEYKHNHRASGNFNYDDFLKMIEIYCNRCVSCNKPFTESNKPTVDHIYPIGHPKCTNNPFNIQPLCLRCNNKKFTKTTDYRPFWALELMK